MSRKKPVGLILAAVAALMGGAAALAQESAADLSSLVGASNLVVQSRVAKIDYRMARAGSSDQAGVPYTIVTYEVRDVLRGSLPGLFLTLRYIGGPDGRGGFLEASEVPIFQVGDEDILFVRGNGENGCPLVGCIGGRYRILNGAVHDGRGSPVQGINGGRIVSRGPAPAEFGIVSFPAPAFDELIKNPEAQEILRRQGLSVEEARRRYEAEAPDRVEMRRVTVAPKSSDAADAGTIQQQQQQAARPIAIDRFAASIKAAAAAARRRAGAVPNIGVDAQIAPPSSATAAPQAEGADAPQQQRSPADIAEERRLPEDDSAAITREKAAR